MAKIKVNPPTLPKNIRQIKIIWETSPRSGVIPSDNPTVPIADAVSNKAVISGISSVLLITIPPTRNKTIYIKKIVAADGTVIKEGKKTVVRNVITEQVARQMREMMEKVVSEGGGKTAAIKET